MKNVQCKIPNAVVNETIQKLAFEAGYTWFGNTKKVESFPINYYILLGNSLGNKKKLVEWNYTPYSGYKTISIEEMIIFLTENTTKPMVFSDLKIGDVYYCPIEKCYFVRIETDKYDTQNALYISGHFKGHAGKSSPNKVVEKVDIEKLKEVKQ